MKLEDQVVSLDLARRRGGVAMEIIKVKKRPEPVGAIRYTGENHEEVWRFALGDITAIVGRELQLDNSILRKFVGISLSGKKVEPGDYITKDSEGNTALYKKEIFEALYACEKAEDARS